MVFGGRLGRAINSSFTNAQSRGDLHPGEPFCAQRGNPVCVRVDARAAELFSLRSRVTQASFYSLDNQAALQFSDGTQDRKHHLPGRRARVHLFRERNELDALGLEGFESSQ